MIYWKLSLYEVGLAIPSELTSENNFESVADCKCGDSKWLAKTKGRYALLVAKICRQKENWPCYAGNHWGFGEKITCRCMTFCIFFIFNKSCYRSTTYLKPQPTLCTFCAHYVQYLLLHFKHRKPYIMLATLLRSLWLLLSVLLCCSPALQVVYLK